MLKELENYFRLKEFNIFTILVQCDNKDIQSPTEKARISMSLYV